MTIPSRSNPGSYSEIDDSASANSLPSNVQKMVIIAPKLAAGSAVPNTQVPVFSADQAAALAGRGSVMHRMVIWARKQFEYLPLYCLHVSEDDDAEPASATVAFSGTATADGSVTVEIGRDRVVTAIASGSAATAVAAAIDAQMDKYADLPTTPSNATGTLTLTCKSKGTFGNFIGKFNPVSSRHEPIVTIDLPGITATVSGFTGGEDGNLDLSAAFDVIKGQRYHHIVLPWADEIMLDALGAHMDMVSDSVRQLGGRGYVFTTSAIADATTLSGVNNRRVHVGALRRCKAPSYELAAQFGALMASESNLAMPVNNYPLIGVDAPEIEDRYTLLEQETLIEAGVTPFEVGAGDTVRCVRAVTTYTENAAGSPDSQWRDSGQIAIVDYLRQAMYQEHRSIYSNSVLKEVRDDNDPDFIVTPKDIVATNIAVCLRIQKLGYIQNVMAHKDKFTAEISAEDSTRVDCAVPLQTTKGLMILGVSYKMQS